MDKKPKKPNQQLILDALAKHGPLTRRELTLLTGIPSPNLSSPLERLMRWELIIIHGRRQSLDRQARRYALANSYIFVPYSDVFELANTRVYHNSEHTKSYIDHRFSEMAKNWMEESR